MPELKKTAPWFKSVYSQVLQDVLKRLDKGFQSFFQRTKQGDVPGFVKFKKKGQWNSITYPQCKKHSSDIITAPKIGDIKMHCHRPIGESAKVKTLTITKDADKWFACFSVELALDIEPKQDVSSAIGIDLGLNDFVYDSDKESKPAPRCLRRREKQLKRLQRMLCRAKKRTPKYYKLLKAVQKCHYRIKCARNDFLHKEAGQAS
ncbi:MAG: transposase [Desulfobacteraceae bacterium]|nr:transposase [Desulfobacteraceae bacterium]